MPGGHMSAFCEPAAIDVDAPLVLADVDRGEARDGVDREHRAVGAHDLGDRLDVVDDAGRGLAQRGEHEVDVGLGGEQAVDLGRVEAAAPARLVARRAGAVGLGELDPALAELARRACEHRVARADEVGDRGLHRPRAARGEQEDVVLRPEHRGQAREDARVQLDAGRVAVVEDRLGHRGAHLGRQRRRAGGHQVLLDERIGRHGSELSRSRSAAVGGEVDAQARGGVRPSLPGGRFHLETPVATASGL